MKELTTKQRELCEAYERCRNKSEAYREVYGWDDTRGGSAKLGNEAQRAFMAQGMDEYRKELREAVLEHTTFTTVEALRRFIQIFEADPNELVSVRRGCCRYCWGEAGGYQWREGDYLDELATAERNGTTLPDPAGGFGFNSTLDARADCTRCDGRGVASVELHDTTDLSPGARLLYQGAKQTKDGVQVLLLDRMKALENATRIIGAYNDTVKIGGSIGAMVAAVTREVTTAEEAAKAYQEMLTAASE